MPRLAAVPAGSEVDPCCCTDCSNFTSDLPFTLSGVSACPGYDLTSINGSGTLTYLGSGLWQTSWSTATQDDLTGSGVLTVTCDAETGNVSASVTYTGTLAGISFDGGGTPLPMFEPIDNTLDCLSGALGAGGTLTISQP